MGVLERHFSPVLTGCWILWFGREFFIVKTKLSPYALWCMASALPNPNDCCNCADGTAINTTTLDAYIQSQVGSSTYVQGVFAVDTVAALRTIATASTNQIATVFGTDAGDGKNLTHWRWDNTGTNADDGVNYVRPSDYTTGGVWARADEEALGA